MSFSFTGELVGTVDCDVVEMPRLSQQVRLEKQHATTSLHVMDHCGNERGIFYALDVAARFCERYGFSHIEPRPILGENGYL